MKQALVLGTLPDNKIPDGYEVWEVSPRSVLCNTPRSEGLLDVKDSLSLILIDSGTFAPALCEMDAQVTEVARLLHEHFGDFLCSQGTESVDALLRSLAGCSKLLEQFRESVGDSDISTNHTSDLVDDLASNAVVRLQQKLTDKSYRSGILEVVARESEIHQPGFEWLRDAFCPYGFVGPVDARHKEWLKYSSSSPEWERTRDPFLTDAQVLSKFEYEADSPGLHSWLRVIFSRFFHPPRSLILCSTDPASDSFLEELSWAVFTTDSQWADAWDFNEYPTPLDIGPEPVTSLRDFGPFEEQSNNSSDELFGRIRWDIKDNTPIRCWFWPLELDRNAKNIIDTQSIGEFRRIAHAPTEDVQALYLGPNIIKSTRKNFQLHKMSLSNRIRIELIASTDTGWPCAFRALIARGSVAFIPDCCHYVSSSGLPVEHVNPPPSSSDRRSPGDTRKISLSDTKFILSSSSVTLYVECGLVGRIPTQFFILSGSKFSSVLHTLAYFAANPTIRKISLDNIDMGRELSPDTVKNDMARFKTELEEKFNIKFKERMGIISITGGVESMARINCTVSFHDCSDSDSYFNEVKNRVNDKLENQRI